MALRATNQNVNPYQKGYHNSHFEERGYINGKIRNEYTE